MNVLACTVHPAKNRVQTWDFMIHSGFWLLPDDDAACRQFLAVFDLSHAHELSRTLQRMSEENLPPKCHGVCHINPHGFQFVFEGIRLQHPGQGHREIVGISDSMICCARYNLYRGILKS